MNPDILDRIRESARDAVYADLDTRDQCYFVLRKALLSGEVTQEEILEDIEALFCEMRDQLTKTSK